MKVAQPEGRQAYQPQTHAALQKTIAAGAPEEKTGGDQPGIRGRVRQRWTLHFADVPHQDPILLERHIRLLHRSSTSGGRRRAAEAGGEERVLADEDLVADDAERPHVRARTCGHRRSPLEVQKWTSYNGVLNWLYDL